MVGSGRSAALVGDEHDAARLRRTDRDRDEGTDAAAHQRPELVRCGVAGLAQGVRRAVLVRQPHQRAQLVLGQRAQAVAEPLLERARHGGRQPDVHDVVLVEDQHGAAEPGDVTGRLVGARHQLPLVGGRGEADRVPEQLLAALFRGRAAQRADAAAEIVGCRFDQALGVRRVGRGGPLHVEGAHRAADAVEDRGADLQGDVRADRDVVGIGPSVGERLGLAGPVDATGDPRGRGDGRVDLPGAGGGDAAQVVTDGEEDRHQRAGVLAEGGHCRAACRVDGVRRGEAVRKAL